MKIVLLGPPASGKGTMAKMISAEYGIPHISAGDLLRERVELGDELGKEIASYINKGMMSPTHITTQIVLERLNKEDCQNGYVLDGFPRDMYQFENFKKYGVYDIVIYLEASENEIVQRVKGRLNCSKCGAIFNERWFDGDTCSNCNSKLTKRADDTMEGLKNRLEIAKNNNQPIIEGFAEKLVSLEADGDPQTVYKKVQAILEQFK